MQYPKRTDIALRFWVKMLKTESTDDCWFWHATKVSQGKYGAFYPTRRPIVLAHRYAYFITVGPIPDGLTIDHLCRNTLCCNPWHLEPKTLRANILRGNSIAAIHARRTHCDYGHLLAGENIRLRKDRVRFCLVCQKRRMVEERARLRQIAATKEKPAPITHCPQGHAYDASNTYLDKQGTRACKACSRASALRWYKERGGRERRQERNKAKG